MNTNSSRKETYTESSQVDIVPQVVVWTEEMVPMHVMDSPMTRNKSSHSDYKLKKDQIAPVDPEPSVSQGERLV